jgi:hypothetical protein
LFIVKLYWHCNCIAEERNEKRCYLRFKFACKHAAGIKGPAIQLKQTDPEKKSPITKKSMVWQTLKACQAFRMGQNIHSWMSDSEGLKIGRTANARW